MRNKALLIILVSAFILLLTACGTTPKLYRLAFNDTNQNVRGSIRLDSTYDDEQIIWTSSDDSVIEIHQNNHTYSTTIIRGSTAKEVTLTAKVGDKEYHYDFVVSEQVSDAFYNMYPSVNDPDHIFEIINYDELLALFNSGTYVLYLGFPRCPWCIEYIYYYNLIAKELGIEVIKYYDFQSIRVTEDVEGEIVLNAQFQALVDLIDPNYLSSKTFDDTTLPWLFAPTLLIISEGEVIDWLPGAFDGHVASKGPMTGTQLKEFQSSLETRFQAYLNALN